MLFPRVKVDLEIHHPLALESPDFRTLPALQEEILQVVAVPGCLGEAFHCEYQLDLAAWN